MSRHERLGILGGTFDPLHLGHLRAAESVREAMDLDEILFIPSRTPPHKMHLGIAPAEDRYRMVLRALENEAAFAVSSVEVEREGPSYTIDTLSVLAERHADAEIFFITGIDSFRDIQTWCRWEELLRSYAFIVHDRPGTDLETAYDSVPEQVHSLMVEVSNDPVRREGRGGVVYLLRTVTLDISSTGVRDMVRAGRSIRYLVPAEVEAYIHENRLYKEGD